MKLLNRFGASLVFNAYAQLQMWSSQAACLVTAKGHTPADYVKGGETLERVWTQTNLEGLALQPMTSLPISLINLQLNGGRDFTNTQKIIIHKLQKEFFELFRLTGEEGLILLFRVGYAASPSARSLRRPVESFLDGV